MNIYRLEPIDPGHASWRQSNEKDIVWACAPSPKAARDLVADKTRLANQTAEQLESPWRSENVTSCALDPTISLMDAETVVRQDGSLVENELGLTGRGEGAAS